MSPRTGFRACLVTAVLAAAPAMAQSPTLRFGGVTYAHRWSQDGQHEFTPAGQEDLERWRDMVTLNVHESVGNGDQLAATANGVLANYQRAGEVVRTESTPRTATAPAEHFIAAVLGSPTFLEAAFARLMLVEGTGVVVVYSHRVYGEAAGPAMSDWMERNGPQIEQALMRWDGARTALAALADRD